MYCLTSHAPRDIGDLNYTNTNVSRLLPLRMYIEVLDTLILAGEITYSDIADVTLMSKETHTTTNYDTVSF